MFDTFNPNSGQRWSITIRLARAAAWPFVAIGDLLTWFVSQVVARLFALLVVISVAAQSWIAVARIDARSRVQAAQARAQARVIRASVAAHVAPFHAAMREVERLDRRYAALDPRFQESLDAATRLFAEASERLISAGVSPDLLQPLKAAMERLQTDA